MSKPRVIETGQGIQGEFNVTVYDQMQRHLRDRGWIETKQIIRSGIDSGRVLEVGPGPGYLGLEWLRLSRGTTLVGLDISPEMIALAGRNARDYGFSDRTEYVLGGGDAMPFRDEQFDAVFSNGSLHEWAEPRATFDQIWRVLKPGGRAFISDLRRDMLPPMRWFLWFVTKPAEIRPGLSTSIAASYTLAELETLVQGCALYGHASVAMNTLGLMVRAHKPA